MNEYFRVNRAIHELEVTATHNSMLTTTTGRSSMLNPRRFWFVHVQQSEAFAEGAARLAAVLRAIAKGAADEATVAGDELMVFLDRLTRSAFGDVPPKRRRSFGVRTLRETSARMLVHGSIKQYSAARRLKSS